MHFNHDNRIGPELAAALVNAAEGADLEQVLRDHAIRWPELDATAARALRAWARRLRAAFTATGAEQRCSAVNELLDEAAGRIHLTTHDGLRPHLHLVSDHRDVVARVKAVTAGGLAILTAWTGGTRLGGCDRDRCERVFVDTSRGGRRRYCTARCGNADAVARHRSARRAADPAS
ncbi:CGNR zinc finger domain-containing protein [Streptomyces jumonjinensis]|uniref:CGNR zinc finger domain-containing protein n=1 Tax=Streptomyces jumonjinensis TaxID=1945 RepID=A0A646KM57_STRJU|nr:CGNR zinc finger domain-containing protein [Streptomyces jumonjinensis]MQT03323.1 CGNR zinc finger domain-containing protein [Streptomyces jumonjinensis]